MDDWYAEAVGCKIGTIPMVVRVHGSDKIMPGQRIRVKMQPGDKWHWVMVTSVNPDGHFFADR